VLLILLLISTDLGVLYPHWNLGVSISEIRKKGLITALRERARRA
jgi:hypothetical protein